MNCRTAERWMDRVLDDDPVGARMAELELHLQACSRCRSQWQALRAAEVALRMPQASPAPEGLLADFRRRLAEEENLPAGPASTPAPTRPRRDWLRWIWPTGSIAAAGMAAALAVNFNLQSVFQEPPRPASSLQTAIPRGQADAPVSASRGTDRRWFAAGRSPQISDPARTEPDPALQAGPGNKPTRNWEFNNPSRTKRGPASSEPTPGGPDRPRMTDTRRLARKPEPLYFRQKQTAPKQPVSPARREAEDLGVPVDERMARLSRSEMALVPPTTDSPRGKTAIGGRLNERNRGVSPRKPATDSMSRLDATVAESEKPSLQYFYSQPSGPAEDTAPIRPDGLYAQGPRPNHISLGVELELEAQAVQEKELEVSPAVLTALQRPVEITFRNGTIQEAARQLTEAADVVLKVDPRVAQANVNFTGPAAQAPLWIVLQEVALQNQLQILPQDNQLILKPVERSQPAAKARAEVTGGLRGGFAGASPASPRGSTPADPMLAKKPAPATNVPPPAVAPAPTGPAAPAEPARKALRPYGFGRPAPGPRAESLMKKEKKGAAPLPLQQNARFMESRALDIAGAPVMGTLPDRRVWPTDWGFLPERGFAIPPPEALPPSLPPRKAEEVVEAKEAAAGAGATQSPVKTRAAKPLKARRKSGK